MKTRVVQFRRKRTGKTDYGKRLRMLRTDKPRLVVRPALKNMSAQIISYNATGDKVLTGASSPSLEKYGWVGGRGNIPAAYLTGYLLGKRAAKKKISAAVLDTGVRTPVKKSRIYACVKGVIDAGVAVPVAKEVLPPNERIIGEHITQNNGKSNASSATKSAEISAISTLFTKVKTIIGEKL